MLGPGSMLGTSTASRTMNTNRCHRRSLWSRIAVGVANAFGVALVASLGYAAQEYTTWRNK
jgi:hypothetical protein